MPGTRLVGAGERIGFSMRGRTGAGRDWLPPLNQSQPETVKMRMVAPIIMRYLLNRTCLTSFIVANALPESENSLMLIIPVSNLFKLPFRP